MSRELLDEKFPAVVLHVNCLWRSNFPTTTRDDRIKTPTVTTITTTTTTVATLLTSNSANANNPTN